MSSRSRLAARRVLTPLIVALLAVDVVVVIARLGNDHTTSPSELVRALSRGEQQTYHARYQATAASGKLQIELWRKPPQFRQRVEANVAGVSARSETLINGNQSTSCGAFGSGTWTCTGPQEGKPSDTDPVAAATKGLAGSEATKRTTKVAGFPAVCYSLRQGGSKPSTVCVTTDGIPLSLTSDNLTFEIVALTRTVDPKDFQLSTS